MGVKVSWQLGSEFWISVCKSLNLSRGPLCYHNSLWLLIGQLLITLLARNCAVRLIGIWHFDYLNSIFYMQINFITSVKFCTKIYILFATKLCILLEMLHNVEILFATKLCFSWNGAWCNSNMPTCLEIEWNKSVWELLAEIFVWQVWELILGIIL